MRKRVMTAVVSGLAAAFLIWGASKVLRKEREDLVPPIKQEETLEALQDQWNGLADIIFLHSHAYRHLDTQPRHQRKINYQEWKQSQEAAQAAWRKMWEISEKMEAIEARTHKARRNESY